ncbi:MAG: PKD-like domain-containing protein [Bacteroidales bacterium]
MAIFTMELPDTDPISPGKQTDVNGTGLFAGTTWSLNWGDGTTNTYTSTTDNDIPTDINFFTHVYNTALNCVYNVTLTVRNPCGEVSLVTYPIDVHGRDQGDNDGQLIIEDVASGETAVVEVCEGSEHILTLRDISDWNCQNPTFPDGTPAPPNDEPRTIQWVYGEDNGGGIQNTIGTTLGTLAPVIIGGANPATTVNGYEQLPVIGPITATGQLSQTILIPEDCRAGEYFDVYLRNWNKCNPYPADPPVFEHIRILVVDAPDAPTAPDRTICFGEDRTLTVTSAPAGTLTWYSDAALTTNVGTGATYIPTQTAPGVYSFWVTDQETSGLFCMSPATEVTLTIREEIERPGPVTGPTGTCPNVNGLVYSVPAVTMTKPIGGAMEYVWSVGPGLTIASGQGTRQITVNVGSTTGNRNINIFLRYATDPRCNSNDRDLTLAVYSTTHNPGAIAGSGICPGSAVNITSTTAASTGAPASSGPTYSWHRSVSPYTVWTALSGTNATFSETMATPGTYRYRRTATFGCGTPVSATVDVDVYSTSHNAGSITSSNICSGQTVSIANGGSATTGAPASSGPVYSWHRSTGPGFGTWTLISGTGATNSQTVSTPGVYRYRRTATFGCGTPVTTTVDVTVFSTTHVAGAIDGNDVCPGDPITINNITSASTGAPASSGPNYSWRRAPGPGFTAWTNLTGLGDSFTETLATPGTYRYERRAAFGCGSAVTATTDINVFSTTHNPGSISNTTACAGSAFTIASASTASTGAPASSVPTYSWHRAPGPLYTAWTARPGTGATITETIATPGNYLYRRTATFGCGTPVSTTADVTVYSTTHNAGAISSSPICAGGTVNILSTTASTTGLPASSGPTYSWHRSVSPFSTWTPLTGSLATFSETMNTPGTYRYRRTATFGCGSTSTTVDVAVNPLPDPVISGANNVCQNDEEIYTTPSVAGHTYSWSTSLGTIVGSSTGNSVTIRWNTVGNGSVTVAETITATGCNKTTTPYPVTVNPGPPTIAPAFMSGLTNICRNGTLNLDVSNVATAIEYIWDFSWIPGTSNATTAASQISIDLTGIAPGTYSVTVAGSNGCGIGPWMTPPHTFNINDIPDLAPLSNTVCSDEASAITLAISNAGPTITGLAYNISSINMNGLPVSAGAPASGTGFAANIIADDAYTNKTSGNVNVVYAVVPVSSQGCPGAQENVTLIVQPEPVLANLSTSKCSDEALGFNLSVAAGSSPAASYNITSINANGLTASAGLPSSGSGLPSNVIADDAWTNTANAPVNVVYSIVPVGTNGCYGDTYTMTITVNPEPALATLNTTKCSDEPLGFSLAVATGSVPAANYNIISINANGLTASAGLPSSGSGLPSNVIADDAWTNITNAPVDVVYSVVPVSAAGCQGDPRTITITVNPEPSLANLSNAVCSDAPSGITLAVAGTSVQAAAYNITNINDGGLISSAGLPAVGNGLLAGVIADDAWTNKTNGNVNVVYTVVPVSANGCAGNPVDVTLTVRPEPVLANLDRSICSDAAFGFNLSLAPGSSPAASYNITAINANGLTPSAGLPSSGSGLPANVIADDAWTNTTNAPVNVVCSIVPVGVNGCSGDTYTMTVTINPEPVLASLNDTKCSDEPLGFSLATAAGSVAASSYNITSINANGLTASAGLPSSGSGLPSNVIANDAWTNITSGPVDVVYTVVPVSAAGCQGNAQTVTITVNPEPVLADLDAIVCSDEVLNFNLATASGSVPAASYNITSINSNGLTASAGLPSSGSGLPASSIADDAWRNTTPVPVNVIYTVVPVSASNCTGNPTTVTITVNPEPVMATPGTTVCSREATGITLAVNAGGVAAASYNITNINSNGLTALAGLPSSGSGLPSSSIADDAWLNTTSANVNVVYTVVPVSADGCEGNPVDITIIVKPEPVITPDQTAGACSGNALDFEIQLDNFTNPAAGVTFRWDAPVLNPVDPAFTGGTARNSASPANITDTFINTLGLVGTATYTITPYYNGCAGQPVDIVITVGSEPVLDAGLGAFVCSNTAIGLVLKEAAGSVTPSHYNIISVNYEGGLTPAGTNAVIPNGTAPATFLSADIYSNLTGVNKTVTYRVQPVLAPDCFGDPVDVVMTIRPQPVIVPGQIKTVCSGVPIDYEIMLVPANTPAGTIFNWNAPTISNGPAQGTAGVNVAADPAGTLHITDIIDNLTSAPITATYDIIPVSADGCAGDAVPVIITINQEPMPPAISGRDDLCVGDNPVVYTVAPVAGSSFHWTVDPAVGIKTFDFNTNAIMISAALTPGTGNITVYETNSLGCSGDPFTLPVQVWESPAKEDITGDAVVCAYTTHTYSVTDRPGSTYSWTLPGGAAIIGNPSASSIPVMFGNVGGTISVRETSIAGCVTNHNPFSVTVNPQPSANISNGGNMCDGGTRPLNVSFIGTAPFQFTYAINGAAQAPVTTSDNPYIINATLAGTYTIVNVTDATGCTATGTGSTTITYFPKPTGIISGNAELCRGSAATLTITFTGVAPFTFTYSDGTTTVPVTNHPNNVYTVNVSPLVSSTYTLTSLTDFNNCDGVLSGTATINVNQPPSLSLAGTNLICYNVATGAVDMTITDGTAPFGIAWTGPNGFTAPTEDISGLNEGYYAVTVTDAKGCSAMANITLTQPQPLNAMVDRSNITCFGADDGTITISGATGGFGTYEYSIDGGANWENSGTFTGLAPGTYVVMIRDQVNPTCMKTLNPGLQITGPAQLTGTVNKTDITCFGANDGTITITNPAGGYGTYQYSRDGGSNWQDTPVFTGLSAGTCDVRIRDRAFPLCVIILNPAVIITEPDALSASLLKSDATCFGANNGTITISGASGGYGTYEFTVNGGGSWQLAGNFSNLAPGTYDVRMRDRVNPACFITLNPAFQITEPPVLSATVASANVTCNGAADGTITISNPLGGYGTYQYTIDGGTTWEDDGSFTNLSPGFYNVKIRDAANPACEITLRPALQITEPAVLSANVAGTAVTCNGQNDGRITITNPLGGYGTYIYSIDGGLNWQASGTFDNLAPGTYDVRIADAANPACVIILNPALEITEPSILSATVTPTMITCFGANNGIISISNPAGGYGTYQYSIDGGGSWQFTGNYTSLTPGTYEVRMRDVAHITCEVILDPSLDITQPAILDADVASANVTCFGGADGTITITNPTGGYGTYQYSVNGGGAWQASGSFTGLGQGTYNVQIRDAANPGCVIVLNNALAITQPQILRATINSTAIECYGSNDGIINITNPLGGYGTYEYSVDGGGNWQLAGSFSNLAPGIYDVRIRDAVNQACVIILNPSVVITEPGVLAAVVAGYDVTCFGADDGRIVISSPSGGYGTYDYSINGGTGWQPTGNFSNLAPGTYDVRIRDRAHPACVMILDAALEITEPPVLTATVTASMVTCNGANDGRIEITGAAGGYGTYQYTINGGAAWQTSGIFNYLAPGTYDVRIRDAANIACSITLDPALAITRPDKLAGVVSGTNVTCFSANDGTISITAPAGGYGTYEYSINGGLDWQPGGSFGSLAPGYYNVQIRDAAYPLCVVVLNGSFRISEPAILAANVNSAAISCYGSDDGTITISGATGGYGTYQYSIDGGTTWLGSGTFNNLEPGTYDVRISDAADPGCFITLNPALVITEPAVLTATVTRTDVTCFGANNGTISITNPSGGYGTYQYSIDGGLTWQGFGTFSNLEPGTYDIRIRDAANNGCIVTLNPELISEPAVLSATINSANVSCFGGNDGTITITGATGGYGTYEYSINGGGSWNSTGVFTNLIAGSYNILIRDAAHQGCIIVLNNAYIITQPAMLSATISKTEVSCNGFNDGTITITNPAGGYGTYEYSINGGGSWQSSGTFLSLPPSAYSLMIRDAANPHCSAMLYPNLLITEPLQLTLSSTGDVVLDCFGDNDGMGTFYASGGTMPYTFLVDDNTTGGTVAAPGFNSQTFFNAGAGLVRVTVVDVNGCSAQAVINLTQPDDLTPGSIEDNQVVCYGDNPGPITQVTGPAGGPGAYTYQWQSSTNAAGPFVNIAANASSNEYTPPSGATYTQYYRRMVTSGTCMPVYSNVVEVLVNPRPVAFLTGGATICPGGSSVIRITMLSGTGPFTVNIANHGVVNNYNSGDDIIVTPAVTTTYSLISVMDANFCDVTEPSPNLSGTAVVIVSDLPVITSFTPPPAVCEFTLASFRVTATGTNLTYQWFVNEGTGFNAVADGGTYFGSMTPTLQIFNTVRGMDGFVYHVEVTGCGTTVTSADATLTVNTAPEITLHPEDSTICLGQDALFEASADGTAVSWQWYVNKGTGFDPVADDANFSGSQTATLAVTDAQTSFNGWIFRAVASGVCGVPVNTNFAILRVINPPAVTIQPQPGTICENTSTTFMANGTGYTSLHWQVNTGAGWTDITDDATYLGAITQQLAILNAPVSMNGYRFRLALHTICSTTYTNEAILTVNPNPVVDFSAIDPLAACGGVPLVLNGNPSGGSGTWSQHRWTGDVGPLNSYTVQSPTFNSFITGSYNLNYRVTDSNGCTANDDLTVTVDYPSAQFTQDVEYGCTPLEVSFTKDMTAIAEWWWDFGDGSPLDSSNENPVHTFVNSDPGSIGYYNVKLRVRSAGNCFAEYTSLVTVYPAIDASFTPNIDVICSGNSITFTALPGATRYFWEYGDGVSGYATNVSSHLYVNLTTAPVVHTVRLTTTSFYNCVDTKTFDITVMPVPLPQFTADPVTQVFDPAGNQVEFSNQTNDGTWNWLWRFGDNTTSTEEEPVHSYNDVGTYTVTLIASNAHCSDSVSHDVTVVPPAPVAMFDLIPSGCAPLYVNINNTSLNTEVPGTTYHWDFGDGSVSTAKNPTYTYFTPGSYRVELVVTGPGGNSMWTQVVEAWPSPKAYFEITPPMVYVNDERVRCFNLSQGATSYLWDFGDGDTSKVREPYHRYLDEGIYDITLWAYSANGCTDMYKLAPAVTVEPVGEIRFATVFTPNKTGPVERTDLPTGGTEIDQFFYPPIRQKVINYKLQIFNRLGVLIFESRDINVPWNGYYKGQLCPQGVYVWYVEGKYADGKPYKMVGNVTLLQ